MTDRSYAEATEMIHVSFHPGVGSFSDIAYCDACGYSKQFIAATKMPCRRKNGPRSKSFDRPTA